MLELVVDNLINSESPKLAEVGVFVECRKCDYRWTIGFDQVRGDVTCPQCASKKQESGTG